MDFLRDKRHIVVYTSLTLISFSKIHMANTLTKRDLVNKISAETNFTQTEVFDIVQRTVDIISETLSAGDRVVIRNFGTFHIKEVKPKVGRNPKNPGKDVPIPARSVVKFKVGKELKESVSQLTK